MKMGRTVNIRQETRDFLLKVLDDNVEVRTIRILESKIFELVNGENIRAQPPMQESLKEAK